MSRLVFTYFFFTCICTNSMTWMYANTSFMPGFLSLCFCKCNAHFTRRSEGGLGPPCRISWDGPCPCLTMQEVQVLYTSLHSPTTHSLLQYSWIIIIIFICYLLDWDLWTPSPSPAVENVKILIHSEKKIRDPWGPFTTVWALGAPNILIFFLLF